MVSDILQWWIGQPVLAMGVIVLIGVAVGLVVALTGHTVGLRHPCRF